MTDDEYDKLTEQCTISITGPRLAYAPMLTDIMQRINDRYVDVASLVQLTCREPERDGSRTYIMHVTFRSGGGIVIGCLRRTQDAETEYHS